MGAICSVNEYVDDNSLSFNKQNNNFLSEDQAREVQDEYEEETIPNASQVADSQSCNNSICHFEYDDNYTGQHFLIPIKRIETMDTITIGATAPDTER
ncbi:hypothetical protein ABK040_003323 [Willaertia magna]